MSDARPGPGRPTLCTPEVQAVIFEGVELGMSLSRAATFAGVSGDTATGWRRRGEGTHPERSSGPEYVEFARLYREARARYMRNQLKLLHEAVSGYWEVTEESGTTDKGECWEKSKKVFKKSPAVAQWLLERAFPNEFGLRRPKEEEVTKTAAPPAIWINTGDEKDKIIAEQRNRIEALEGNSG